MYEMANDRVKKLAFNIDLIIDVNCFLVRNIYKQNIKRCNSAPEMYRNEYKTIQTYLYISYKSRFYVHFH